MRCTCLVAVALGALAPAPARAEPGAEPSVEPGAGPGRRFHGSVGAGGALLLTGADGDHARLEIAADAKLGGRYGALLAWRALDDGRWGILTTGLVFEAGAARPRLVLDLHVDLGADLDARAPLVGGGIRTTLGIAGPLGVVLDSGAYLVIDGLDGTRLQLQSSALVGVRW